MTQLSFGARLAAEFAAGRHLCAGIDPAASTLARWELPNTAAGAEQLGLAVVHAAAGVAACVKPQVAYFERFGAAGFAALERVIRAARDAGLLVIADCKRGDIGTSFTAYAESWLAPGAPLESDAMTAHPYHGVGSLRGAHEFLAECGKGLFVLAATSNPEARESQCASIRGGLSVAASVVQQVAAWNSELAANGQTIGSVGVVLGATLNLADFEIATDSSPVPVLPVLAPGFGAQGGDLSRAGEIFGELSKGLLANESRSLLGGGKAEIVSRMRERADAVRQALSHGR